VSTRRQGRPRRALRHTHARPPRLQTAEHDVALRRRASAPPSRLGGSSCSRVRPFRCHERQVDVQKGRVCQMATARPPSDGSNGRCGDRESPACAGLSQCAREDSNLHGPFSPQGPQPRTRCVDALGSVKIVQIVGFAGRIGRDGRGGCCHECCHAASGRRRRVWSERSLSGVRTTRRGGGRYECRLRLSRRTLR